MPRWRGLLHLPVVAAIALVGTTAGAQAPLPSALADFLRGHSEFRLLEPGDLGASRDAMLKDGRFSPVVEAPFDAAGTKAIYAIVVGQSGGAKMYGALALHPGRPAPLWVIPPRTSALVGITASSNSVSPLGCYQCDSSSFLLWKGAE